MSKIIRTVTIREVNDILNCYIPSEIKQNMNIDKGDLLEMTFDSSNPNRLMLRKIDLKNKNIWFIIGNNYWWSRLIDDERWDLQNPNSKDMKLFKSIKPKDIILSYYKSPTRSIKNILITNRGFDVENETIDIHRIHELKYPITYDDFKEFGLMSEYQKMPRRSVVPVNRPDWEKIISIISKRDNQDLGLKISKYIDQLESTLACQSKTLGNI